MRDERTVNVSLRDLIIANAEQIRESIAVLCAVGAQMTHDLNGLEAKTFMYENMLAVGHLEEILEIADEGMQGEDRSVFHRVWRTIHERSGLVVDQDGSVSEPEIVA